VKRLIQEAIELHLEGMREEGMSVPQASSFAGVVKIEPAARCLGDATSVIWACCGQLPVAIRITGYK
jgi:hypothetical protein